MPHSKAFLVHYFKDYIETRGLEEHTVWVVPQDEKNPDGIRYRLVFIPVGRTVPAVLYDNHHPKGHHKHINGQEVPYEYRSFEDLFQDFQRDVEAYHENTRD